jgi:hypothetical protein
VTHQVNQESITNTRGEAFIREFVTEFADGWPVGAQGTT